MEFNNGGYARNGLATRVLEKLARMENTDVNLMKSHL